MTGMIGQAIASEKAEELRSLILQSGVYLSRLVDVGNLEYMSLTDIHNILVDQGGVRKDEWLSSRNVVSEGFFASDYKGVTSGRSGNRTEYTKPAEWVRHRDLWRQKNLLRIARSDYAVVNVASRLFPHDPFDISILSCNLSVDERNRLGRLIDYYKNEDIAVIFRGFPARLVESLDLLLNIFRNHQVRSIILTTGFSLHPLQKKVLENHFGECNVFSEYGAQDLGIQLYSCEHCGMFHVENPRSLISIRDRKIFATDLYSHTQPVIAADTADLATVSSDACPAGADLVFMPVCMPPVLPPPPAVPHGNIRHPTPRSQSLLMGPTAHPVLADVLNSGSGIIHDASNKRRDHRQEILHFLARNDINGCRSLLASLLDKEMLLLWKQRNISLVSFLIGFLVITDNTQWMDFAEPWIDNRGSCSIPDMLSATHSSCQYIAKYNELGAIALLGIDIVFRLFSLNPATPFIKALDSIETLLGELCTSISNSKIPLAALPLVSAIHSYLLAYCWRHRRDMLEMLLSAYSGFKTYSMDLIEEHQSLGLLKKI